MMLVGMEVGPSKPVGRQKRGHLGRERECRESHGKQREEATMDTTIAEEDERQRGRASGLYRDARTREKSVTLDDDRL